MAHEIPQPDLLQIAKNEVARYRVAKDEAWLKFKAAESAHQAASEVVTAMELEIHRAARTKENE